MEFHTTTEPGQLRLVVVDAPSGLMLIEIQGSQSLVDQHGLAPPEGFEEAHFGDQLPAEDTAGLAEAAAYNLGQFRWIGKVPLNDGQPVLFPIRVPLAQPAILTVTYRYRAFGFWPREISEYVRFAPGDG